VRTLKLKTEKIVRINTFASLKVPAYRIMLGSLLGQWVSYSMLVLVRSLLIYRLTDSASLVGTLALAGGIPMVIASLFGGALGDRIQKKYILLVCRSGLALVYLVQGILLITGYLGPEHAGSWWVLIAAAIVDGALNGVAMPTATSMIPDLVGNDRVMNAISINFIGNNILQLFLPAAAGFIVDRYGFAQAFFVMCGANVISTICIAFLPRPPLTHTDKRDVIADIVAGFKYALHRRAILLVLLFMAVHVIFGNPFATLLPVFSEEVLNISASQMGVINSVVGIGALVGAVVMASVSIRRRGLILILTGLGMGIPTLVAGLSQSWYLVLVMALFIGLAPAIHGTLTNTLMLVTVDPEFRTRMQSLLTMAFSLSVMGGFAGGLLSDIVGVQWTIAGSGIAMCIVAILLFIFAPGLRKIK
jgi:MFS family permease